MKQFILKIQNLLNVMIVENLFTVIKILKYTQQKFIIRLIKPINAKYAKNLSKEAHN